MKGGYGSTWPLATGAGGRGLQQAILGAAQWLGGSLGWGARQAARPQGRAIEFDWLVGDCWWSAGGG